MDIDDSSDAAAGGGTASVGWAEQRARQAEDSISLLRELVARAKLRLGAIASSSSLTAASEARALGDELLALQASRVRTAERRREPQSAAPSPLTEGSEADAAAPVKSSADLGDAMAVDDEAAQTAAVTALAAAAFVDVEPLPVQAASASLSSAMALRALYEKRADLRRLLRDRYRAAHTYVDEKRKVRLAPVRPLQPHTRRCY